MYTNLLLPLASKSKKVSSQGGIRRFLPPNSLTRGSVRGPLWGSAFAICVHPTFFELATPPDNGESERSSTTKSAGFAEEEDMRSGHRQLAGDHRRLIVVTAGHVGGRRTCR